MFEVLKVLKVLEVLEVLEVLKGLKVLEVLEVRLGLTKGCTSVALPFDARWRRFH